ncbi:unnamed protein product [Blepharisma stoltei]|uniref:Uncharacterized protein n=1 Tax=Blepharisma stoltei TaxID=1481888 RepID=A0AAU9JQI2_9CILI|nr:unnamed protein product [Blepharisma stoltei]
MEEDKYVKSYSAGFWKPDSDSSKRNLEIPSLITDQQSPIISLTLSQNWGFLLSADGKLCEIANSQSPTFPVEIPTPIKLIQVVCNDSIAIAIGSNRNMYSWGYDQDQTGLLGIPDVYEASSPTQIPGISNITQISIGTSHAAAINQEGQLITWGSGFHGELGTSGPICRQSPQIVTKAEKFKINQILCGDTFTCICTDGCYVYIFGSLGNSHHHLRGRLISTPKPSIGLSQKSRDNKILTTVPDLERHAVISMCCGNGFVSVLTDLGEVFFFDDCLTLIKAPIYQDSIIEMISCTENAVYGIDKNNGLIFEWKYNRKIRLSSSFESNICQLSCWSATVFAANEEYTNITLFNSQSIYSLFSCQTSIGFIEPIGYYLSIVYPYKRSEIAQQAVRNSLDLWNSAPVTPHMFNKTIRMESPVFIPEEENEMEKIFLEQINQEQEKQLLNAFRPTVFNVLQRAFKKIKEYTIMKIIHKRTLAATLVPTSIKKVLNRHEISSKFSAFQAIRNYVQNLIIIQEQNERNKQKRQLKIKEGTKLLLKMLSDCIFREEWFAFSQIKEYQLLYLQKKNAIMIIRKTFRNFIGHKVKCAFGKWKYYLRRMKSIEKQNEIKRKKEMNKADIIKLEHSLNIMNVIRMRTIRYGLNVWKEKTEKIRIYIENNKKKTESCLKNFVILLTLCREERKKESISAIKMISDAHKTSEKLKTLGIKLSEKVRNITAFSLNNHYKSLISYSRLSSYRPALIKIANICRLHMIETFSKIFKASKKLIMLSDLLKKHINMSLKNAFTVLSQNCRQKLNSRYQTFETPDISIFQESDMVLIQSIESIGDLTTSVASAYKKLSTLQTSNDLTIETKPDFNISLQSSDSKSKNLELFTYPSVSVLQTPREKRQTSSGIQTSIVLEKELTYQQKIIRNIMAKAGYLQEKSKSSPKRPPWIPPNKTVELSNAKNSNNSQQKRADYDNHLKERIKIIQQRKNPENLYSCAEIKQKREVCARRIKSYPDKTALHLISKHNS